MQRGVFVKCETLSSTHASLECRVLLLHPPTMHPSWVADDRPRCCLDGTSGVLLSQTTGSVRPSPPGGGRERCPCGCWPENVTSCKHMIWLSANSLCVQGSAVVGSCHVCGKVILCIGMHQQAAADHSGFVALQPYLATCWAPGSMEVCGLSMSCVLSVLSD